MEAQPEVPAGMRPDSQVPEEMVCAARMPIGPGALHEGTSVTSSFCAEKNCMTYRGIDGNDATGASFRGGHKLTLWPVVIAGLISIGAAITPTVHAQQILSFPELIATGVPLPQKPQFIDFPALTVTGIPLPQKPQFIDFPALIATGIPLPQKPRFIDFPALVATGVPLPQKPQFIDFPPLVAHGLVQLGTPPSGLEILALPQGAVTGQYLRLDRASIARDEALKVHYSSLPNKAGAIVLFYVGGETPERLAWHYTSATLADGVFERSPNSLPSKTGPWKACVGFGDTARAGSATPDAFVECLDFVLVGAGSLNAKPVVTLPDDPLRAGRAFDLRYAGMPPINSRIAIVREGGTAPAASHLTSSRPSGTWTTQLDHPGTYELTIYFTGDAPRARMTLEVQP